MEQKIKEIKQEKRENNVIDFKERNLLPSELFLFFDVFLNEKVFLIKGIKRNIGLKDKICKVWYTEE